MLVFFFFFLRGGQWPAIEGNFQRRCVSFFVFFRGGGAMASHRRELSKKVCYFFKGGAMASHRRELSKKVC